MIRNIFFVALVLLQFSCNNKSVPSSSISGKEDKKELRVLSYNIHHANPPSRPDFIDIDAIVNVIKESKADLVALQEVDKNTLRCGRVDQAKLIAEKTGLQYQFYKAIDHDGGDYGLAILSRYPLKDIQLLPLPQQVKAENRILAYATVSIDGQKMIFANTHLDAIRGDENRVVQMRQILKTFEQEKLPVILCGDLNSVAEKEPIKLLDEKFRRTCVSDCPGTIPHNNPNRTIDYIATKNVDWKLLSYKVIAETYASDHRPVLATFQLK